MGDGLGNDSARRRDDIQVAAKLRDAVTSARSAHGFRVGRSYWIAAALAILAAIVTFDAKLYINGDNVDYMFLGRAVREGDLWPSNKYPPLFPYLLATVQSIFGMALVPQKIAVLVCYAVAVFLVAPVFAARRTQNGAWVFGLAITLVPTLEYAHYTMSEIPYMLCLAGLLRAVHAETGLVRDRTPGVRTSRRFDIRGVRAALGRRHTWELAFWLAAAFYTRSAGLALGAAVFLVFWQRGESARGLSVCVALLFCLLPWLVHTWTTPGGNPYFEQWARVNPYYPHLGTLDAASLVQRVVANAKTYFLNEIPIAVLPILYRSTWSDPSVLRSSYLWPIALLVLVPFIVGVVRGLRFGEPAAWVLMVVIGGSCFWPEIWAGTRFLAPIVPLAFLVFWDGVDVALARFRGGRMARTSMLVLLTLLSVRNLVFYHHEIRSYPPVWENYFQAVRWIEMGTPKDAVVIDRKPAMVEYLTARKAVSFPRETDPDRMLDAFASRGADWVILPSLPYDDIPRYLQPALQQRVRWFEPAFVLEEPPTYIARFRRAEWVLARGDSLGRP